MAAVPKTVLYVRTADGAGTPYVTPPTRSQAAVSPPPPIVETVEYVPTVRRHVTYAVMKTQTAHDQAVISAQLDAENQFQAMQGQAWRGAPQRGQVSLTA